MLAAFLTGARPSGESRRMIVSPVGAPFGLDAGPCSPSRSVTLQYLLPAASWIVGAYPAGHGRATGAAIPCPATRDQRSPSLGEQAIADPRLGHDVARGLCILLDLFAQPRHIDVNVVRLRFPRRTPYLLKQ